MSVPAAVVLLDTDDSPAACALSRSAAARAAFSSAALVAGATAPVVPDSWVCGVVWEAAAIAPNFSPSAEC